MKIAISAQGNTLDSAVDPRFGRCAYFFIVDLADGDVKVLENHANTFATGAGIKSASTIVDEGVQTVLTGQVGPKASHVFETARVHIYQNVTGTVSSAIERYKNGELNQTG